MLQTLCLYINGVTKVWSDAKANHSRSLGTLHPRHVLRHSKACRGQDVLPAMGDLEDELAEAVGRGARATIGAHKLETSATGSAHWDKRAAAR